jgi:tetratricopeptide (TPR) repeat protein
MHLAAGLMSLSRDQLEQAEREASLARTIAVEAGLGREVGEASGLMGMVAHRRGEWREVFRREFEQTVRATPAFAEFVFDAHLCLAEFSLHGPDGPTGVRSFANELLALAEERGSVLGTALATLMIGESRLLTGDLADARRDLERAAELHSNVGASAGWALSLQRLAEQAVAVGHAARATPLLRQARAIAEASPLASHLLVRILATTVQAESDPAARMRSLDQAEADLVGREVCEPCSIDLLVTAAVTCAVTHRADDARGWLDRADHAAGMWQGGPWSAAVWEARGQLRLAEGRPDQAAALFREAAEMFADSGRSMAAARCRHSAEAAMRPSGNGRGTSLR